MCMSLSSHQDLQQTRETLHQKDFLYNNQAAMIIHGIHSRPSVPNCPRTFKIVPKKVKKRKKNDFWGRCDPNAYHAATKDTSQGYQSISGINRRRMICSSCIDCEALSCKSTIEFPEYSARESSTPTSLSSHQIITLCSSPAKLSITEPSYTMLKRR